jgi:hypothetical protein
VLTSGGFRLTGLAYDFFVAWPEGPGAVFVLRPKWQSRLFRDQPKSNSSIAICQWQCLGLKHQKLQVENLLGENCPTFGVPRRANFSARDHRPLQKSRPPSFEKPKKLKAPVNETRENWIQLTVSSSGPAFLRRAARLPARAI